MSLKVNHLGGFGGGLGPGEITTASIVATSDTGTSLSSSITLPSDIQSGDLIVISATVGTQIASTSDGLTKHTNLPTGYKLIMSGYTYDAAATEGAMWAKIADGSEASGSFTFCDSGGSSTGYAVCCVIRGDAPIERYHVAGDIWNSDTTPSSQGFQAEDLNYAVVYLAHYSAANSTMTDTDAGFTGATPTTDVTSGSNLTTNIGVQVKGITYDAVDTPDSVVVSMGDEGNANHLAIRSFTLFGRDQAEMEWGVDVPTVALGTASCDANGVITLPSYNDGDVVILTVYIQANQANGSIPSGWTGRVTGNSSNTAMILYKWMDSGDGSTIDVHATATGTPNRVGYAVISRQDGSAFRAVYVDQFSDIVAGTSTANGMGCGNGTEGMTIMHYALIDNSVTTPSWGNVGFWLADYFTTTTGFVGGVDDSSQSGAAAYRQGVRHVIQTDNERTETFGGLSSAGDNSHGVCINGRLSVASGLWGSCISITGF